MINYCKAELFRLFHKRSFILFYAIFIIAAPFIIIGVDRIFPITQDLFYHFVRDLLLEFYAITIFLPLLVHLITNDLSAKTLVNVCSGGVNRKTIILAKFFLFFLIGSIADLIFVGTSLIAAPYLGVAITGSGLLYLLKSILVAYLLNVGYLSIAMIAAYFFQSTPLTIILSLISTMGLTSIVNPVLGLKIPFFKWMDKHALYHYTGELSEIFTSKGNISLSNVFGILFYVVVFLGVALLLFIKREVKDSE